MAVLVLRFCARAFSSCGKQGPLLIAVRGPLTIAASLVAEHRLQRRRLSSCGSRAQLLRGMWDLPRPGLEPVSPALAGRLSTTAPPGKPSQRILMGPQKSGFVVAQRPTRPFSLEGRLVAKQLRNVGQPTPRREKRALLLGPSWGSEGPCGDSRAGRGQVTGAPVAALSAGGRRRLLLPVRVRTPAPIFLGGPSLPSWSMRIS